MTAPNPLKLHSVSPVIGGLTFNTELIVAPNGLVTGHATVSQTISPPFGGSHTFPVQGQEYETGFGVDFHLINIHGFYVVPIGPPPLIGLINVPVTAAITLHPDWSKGATIMTVNHHPYFVTLVRG